TAMNSASLVLYRWKSTLSEMPARRAISAVVAPTPCSTNTSRAASRMASSEMDGGRPRMAIYRVTAPINRRKPAAAGGAVQTSGPGLRGDALHHAGVGDGLADVVEPAHPGHGALHAQAEAGVGDAAVLPQVQVPLERVAGELVLLEALLQGRQVVL